MGPTRHVRRGGPFVCALSLLFILQIGLRNVVFSTENLIRGRIKTYTVQLLERGLCGVCVPVRKTNTSSILFNAFQPWSAAAAERRGRYPEFLTVPPRRESREQRAESGLGLPGPPPKTLPIRRQPKTVLDSAGFGQ